AGESRLGEIGWRRTAGQGVDKPIVVAVGTQPAEEITDGGAGHHGALGTAVALAQLGQRMTYVAGAPGNGGSRKAFSLELRGQPDVHEHLLITTTSVSCRRGSPAGSGSRAIG